MKTLCLIGLMALLTTGTLHVQQSAISTSNSLDWLLGTWERTGLSAGQSAHERWWREDGMLRGIGVTMQGTDTVFVERLSLRRRDGALHYVADVSHNAEPTWFKITDRSESGFVCENPEHDFPKKIEYRLEEGGRLQVTISGDGNSAEFRFRKKEG